MRVSWFSSRSVLRAVPAASRPDVVFELFGDHVHVPAGTLAVGPDLRADRGEFRPHPVELRPDSPELRPHSAAADSFLHHEPPRIRGTGYVVESLEAALWAFAKSTSFEDGALLAVNLGDDADTTGAVYGQIAGAYYGAEAIPRSWRSKLAHLDTLENFAERLLTAGPR